MAQMYYSGFASHCLRFYARHVVTDCRTEVERLNWWACHNAMQEFAENEQEMLMGLYQQGDTLADKVYAVSVKYDVPQGKIWKLIGELEKRVCKRRGII